MGIVIDFKTGESIFRKNMGNFVNKNSYNET